LLLLPPGAHDVAEDVAALAGLDGFTMTSPDSLQIHDRYFDTTDARLRSRRVALRMRRNGGTLLALKVGGTHARGVSDRLEIEAPWSEDSFRAIVDRLASQGIPLGPEHGMFTEDPEATLRSMGLGLIQERYTHRRTRDVLAAGQSGRVAELDIDDVRYVFEGTTVRLLELEVEAKGAGDMAVVERLLEALHDRYADRLQIWPHSKLATGLALRELVPDGVGDLTLDAALLRSVEAYLESRDAPPASS